MLADASGPRYVRHQRLGVGGMGVVHLGSMLSPAGERLVAIKQLFGKGEVDDAARRRLVAEARLVFQLTHANVCQVLDLCESVEGTFVVMEYVRGCDLRALLLRLEQEGQGLAPATAVYVAREVARGLDYAHRRADDSGRALGIVHGDVTPQNILLSVEGEVKLADFGIARAIHTAAPGEGLVGGTLGFMAPEVFHGLSDHRADIFSLAATLHYALSGRRPGPIGPNVASLDGHAAVTPDLRAILERALAAKPASRQSSAAELERHLSGWLARRHPEFTPSTLARAVLGHARAGEEGAPAASRNSEELQMVTLLEHKKTRQPPRPAPAPQGGTATAWPVRRRRHTKLIVIAAVAATVTAVAMAGGSRLLSSTDRRAESLVLAPDPPPAQPPSEPPAPEVHPRPAPAPSPKESPARRGELPPRQDHLAAPGYISVSATPWGAVFIDEKRVAAETPLYRHPLKPGRHRVAVEWQSPKRRSPSREIVIQPGELETLGFEPR